MQEGHDQTFRKVLNQLNPKAQIVFLLDEELEHV